MIKVFNDLLPQSYVEELNSMICSREFPWYYNESIANSYEDEYAIFDKSLVNTTPGLTHTILSDEGHKSFAFDIVKPIILFLEKKENIILKNFLRIRLRRTLPYPGHADGLHNIPHCDFQNHPEPYRTLVYYVEDSDGDTVFFNKVYTGKSTSKEMMHVIMRNPPKKGNCVYFDGNIYHAGNNPMRHSTRTIINFDFTYKQL